VPTICSLATPQSIFCRDDHAITGAAPISSMFDRPSQGRVIMTATTPLLGFLALTVLCCCGCVHHQLRFSTLHQARTINDLQYEQVLDNLALISKNPDALPYFAVPGSGTTNVQQSVNGGAAFNYTRVMFSGWSFNFGGNRSNSGNWSFSPVNDPDKLKLMRCVYQFALGVRSSDPCTDCVALLRAFFGDDFALCHVPAGWLHAGCEADVPGDACYVGHAGDRYAWVTAEGVAGLSQVTLAILDIATAASVVPPTPAVPTLEETRYYLGEQELLRTERRILPDRAARAFAGPQPPAPTPRARLDFFDPIRGLFFVPRPE
jgi:hypothetical protein